MFVLFEEGGKFLAGRILSQADVSMQVELDSGKRVKLKSALALLQFEKPNPQELLAQAAEVALGMDVNLAWEFAADEEFGYADLAHEYFSAKPSTLELAATLMCLFNAPHYFRRAGKGRFKKAGAEVVQQALAAIEKKKAVTAQISQWATELGTGRTPDAVRTQLYKILFKPDKNAAEYKAVVEASRATRTPPLELLQKAGAIGSAYQFHWQRFLFDQFPKGTGFPALEAPAIQDDLPTASVRAFSIDDSNTTEIDDALSVQGLGSGEVTLGVHIAAPALVISAQSAIDKVARERLSTVYMPGHKVTMLPDAIVQNYTLAEGRDCPAVSLYVTLDEATLAIKNSRTVLERVPIVANLRHDVLDTQVTEAALSDLAAWKQMPGNTPLDLREQLAFLYRLARQLKAAREVVRGKPETFNRPDYNFSVKATEGSKPGDLQGHEVVEITTRRRGAPLDLIVAEAMILANSTWGQWMASLGVPAIYRSQASLAPGVKVRMGTKALPHAGIGVPSYAWSTSPLRRYTDLVNQWQIIACAKHGSMAALAAPFKPKDAELFAIISSFDATYAAYSQFQNGMERYWTLQYVRQQGITEIVGVVFKEGMVRADDIPLVLPVLGTMDVPRGTKVRVKLGEIDEITLDISGTLIERLDTITPEGEPEAEDEEDLAGPIAIAVDVSADDSASQNGDNQSP
ncbi:MAG: RNB domain-containing ribonuclease [Burkholderiaceae bacterium]